MNLGMELFKRSELNETFFFENHQAYRKMKSLNILFTVIVCVYPVILNISRNHFSKVIIDLFFGFVILLPYIVDRRYGVIIFEEFKFIITFHCMLHTIFGRAYGFYDKYPLYDDILHILGGGLIAGVSFSIILSVYLNYFSQSDKFILFCTSVTTLGVVNIFGVGWEIAEFFGDIMFNGSPGYRLAQADLFDTMTDLIENNIGALLMILFLRRMISTNSKNRNVKELFKKLISVSD
ncbi:MAG: hypothetical protein GX994_03105 [Firmicutes bacterium]|nr:hypothetical protein [Bacillota bacterium]